MQFERFVDLDLRKGRAAEVELGPILFEDDSNSLKLGVRLYNNGAVDVDGTVTGWAIVSTGQTIDPFEDTGKSGNEAWVIVPQDALIPGRIEIFLRITGDADSAVTLHATATVRRTKTGEIIVPGDPLPDVDQIRELLSDLDDAIADAEGIVNTAVRYTAQTKDSAAKAIARANVGAVALGDITDAVALDAPIAKENNYIRHASGGYGSSSTYNATEMIDVSGCTWIKYKRTGVAGATSTAGMAFYDANGEYISGIASAVRQSAAGYETDLYEAAVPAGAAFAAFTTYADTATYGEFAVYKANLIGVGSAVSYTAQEKTDAEKAQARENINAASTHDVESVFDAAYDNNVLVIYKANLENSETTRGVTFAWSGSKCHVSGTTAGSSSGTGNHTFYNEANKLPFGMAAGGTYYVEYASTNVTLKVYPYVNGQLVAKVFDSKQPGTVTFPANLTGLFLRMDADWGVSINETVEPVIKNHKPGEDYGDRVQALENGADAIGNNAFHQYNFLASESIDGYYDATGAVKGTDTWKTYLVPITNTDKYYFCNRNVSLALLDASKDFIALVDHASAANAIQGISATVEAWLTDITDYPEAKYVGVPRNATNLTYLRSAQRPDVIPIFPFESNSICADIEIVTFGRNVYGGDGYRHLRFVRPGFMVITTGEHSSTTSNYASDFALIKKGTVVSTKNTPYRVRFRGMNSDGAVFVPATDEYAFDRDFWGIVDYSADGSWAWSDFAPQNLSLKQAQIFVSMVTPEDRARNPWFGKSWYCYGTSISDIGANDAAGNNGHSGKYPLCMDAVTGMTRTNGAIGSGGIRTNASHGGNVLAALLTTPYDVDLVTLETLPNDGVDDPANVGEITDTATTTICGAFKAAVEYIITRTRARFVLIFVGGNASGASAMNSTHVAYTAAKDKLKQIAEYYGVPVIDAEKDAADWAHRKSGVLLADHIHPNYLGGYVYGRYIWDRLKEIHPNPIYPQST